MVPVWHSVMIPAYDDPLLWEGHASMVHEVRRQLPEGVKPDAVFCSVGGGGLAGGIMEGCKAVGWDDGEPCRELTLTLKGTLTSYVCAVPLVTVETHGSNCFYQSLSLNEGLFAGSVASRPVPEGTTVEYCEENNVKLAHLAKLSSRATSLGASSPSGAIVRKALDRSGSVKSICISDELAMQTTLFFAGESRRTPWQRYRTSD